MDRAAGLTYRVGMAPFSVWCSLVAAVSAVLAVAPARSEVPPQATAFNTDCSSVGGSIKQGYQFIATCAGRTYSPDRRYSIVQRAYDDKQPAIQVQDAHGRTIATLKSLRDDMPFRVFWAPDSRWFFVNHHVGSFMDEMQLFEIAGRSVIERRLLVQSAIRAATRRFPCLPPRGVLPNGSRWMPDGRSIVMVTISRPTACSESGRPGSWKPLWMMGDARTGRIDRSSVRVARIARDSGELREPRDGVYARR